MAKIGKKRKGKEGGFSLIKEGTYTARIIKSKIEKTDSGNEAIILTWKIGKRELKQWYNIQHDNEEVSNIAWENLDSIAFACGLKDYNDTKQFHGIDLEIDVGFSKDKKFNNIKRYSRIEKKNKKNKKPW